MSLRTIRILSVEDHAFVAESLKTRLEMEPDFEVVGMLGSADTLVSEAKRLRPDVILLDIEMPGQDPFEAIDDLKRRGLDSKVVMLSAHVRDHFINMAVDAGAWGYFYKGDDPGDIVAGIRRVMAGKFACGPKIQERWGAGKANGEEAAPGARHAKLDALTSRELQVLRMIGQGLGRTEIASTLHRSPKTVDCHRAAIMKKLDIRDRVELARYAIREGLAEA